jgi:hypothetical protein
MALVHVADHPLGERLFAGLGDDRVGQRLGGQRRQPAQLLVVPQLAVLHQRRGARLELVHVHIFTVRGSVNPVTGLSYLSRMYDARSSDPRLALAGVKFMEDECEWLMVRAVRLARAAGYDWGRIGRLLGRSRRSGAPALRALAPIVGPCHRRARAQGHRHEFDELYQRFADARRRREFETDDDIVAW